MTITPTPLIHIFAIDTYGEKHILASNCPGGDSFPISTCSTTVHLLPKDGETHTPLQRASMDIEARVHYFGSGTIAHTPILSHNLKEQDSSPSSTRRWHPITIAVEAYNPLLGRMQNVAQETFTARELLDSSRITHSLYDLQLFRQEGPAIFSLAGSKRYRFPGNPIQLCHFSIRGLPLPWYTEVT